MVTKINCISHIYRWFKLLVLSRKIKRWQKWMFTATKLLKNYLWRLRHIVLDGYRDNHDDMSLVDMAMNQPPQHQNNLPCYANIMICLELIILLIKSAFTNLLIINLTPIVRKIIDAFFEINMGIETVIWK